MPGLCDPRTSEAGEKKSVQRDSDLKDRVIRIDKSSKTDVPELEEYDLQAEVQDKRSVDVKQSTKL